MSRKVEVEMHVLTEGDLASKVKIGETELWISNEDIPAEKIDPDEVVMMKFYDRLKYSCQSVKNETEAWSGIQKVRFFKQEGKNMLVTILGGEMDVMVGEKIIKDVTPGEAIYIFDKM